MEIATAGKASLAMTRKDDGDCHALQSKARNDRVGRRGRRPLQRLAMTRKDDGDCHALQSKARNDSGRRIDGRQENVSQACGGK